MSLKIVTSGIDDDEEEWEDIPEELLPHEVALSFDHILEQIFTYLKTSDLFSCRLVSHRFLKFAQAPLEKQVRLRFQDYFQKVMFKRPTWKTLSDLTKFLNKSSSTSRLLSLPCTQFEFNNVAQLGDTDLQNFLNARGHNIRKLMVDTYYYDPPTEDVLMTQLYDLLTRQAPQLENLSLVVHAKVKWLHQIPNEFSDIFANRVCDSALVKTDPEYEQISKRIKFLGRKSSLKTLKVTGGNGLAKVLEFVIQLSPNLQEVVLKEDKQIHLVQPVARVHLIKSMKLWPESQIDESSQMSLSHRLNKGAIEKILPENKLRLRELEIGLFHALPLCRANFEFEKKVVFMINRILEDSKDTLEFLRLNSFTFLRGMKMPTPMSKVREIQIHDESSTRVPREANSTIFPQGFSLPETFPRLTSVKLLYFVPGFFEYLNCLNFGGSGEVGSCCSITWRQESCFGYKKSFSSE